MHRWCVFPSRVGMQRIRFMHSASRLRKWLTRASHMMTAMQDFIAECLDCWGIASTFDWQHLGCENEPGDRFIQGASAHSAGPKFIGLLVG